MFAFVLMPFDTAFDDIYKLGIKAGFLRAVGVLVGIVSDDVREVSHLQE
jgi:hypothetical protein